MHRAGLLLLIFATPASAQSLLLPRLDDKGWPLPPGAVARLGPARLRHPDRIVNLALSSDGKLVAAISHDGNVIVYDTSTARPRFRTVLPFPDDDEPYLIDCHLVFRAEDRELAVLASNVLRVFDLATGRERVKRAGRPEHGWSALSPDGRLAVMGAHRTCVLIDLETDVVLRELFFAGDVPDYAKFTSLGLLLHAREKVRFHDLTTGVWRAELPNPKVKEYHDEWVAPTRHGHVAARIPCDADKRILFQDVGSGRQWFAPRSLTSVYGGAFTPDGRTLAVRTRDGTFVLDARAGAEPRRLDGGGWDAHLTFSADGRVLAGANGPEIFMWEVASGRMLPASLSASHRWQRLRFLDQRRLMVTGRAATEYDVGGGRVIRRHSPDRYPELHDVSPDGTALAVRWDYESVRVLDMAQRRVTLTIGGGHDVCLFGPDGRRLYSVGADGSARAWEPGRDRALFEFPRDHPAGELDLHDSSAALSADGRTFAAAGSAGESGALRIWDARDGRRLRDYTFARRFTMSAVSLSADGRRVAFIGYNPGPDCHGGPGPEQPDLRVWDWAAEKLICAVPAVPHGKRQVALSPDGRSVALGCKDGRVLVWEVATGFERACFTEHTCEVTSLAFSPDGRYLASLSDESPVIVWDLYGPLPGLDSARTRAGLIDRDTAVTTIRRLLAKPEVAVPVLRDQFPTITRVSTTRLQQLVSELDDRTPAARAAAFAELRRVADQVTSDVAAGATSAEAAHRLRRLREQVEIVDAELAARLRALEVAERLNTPDARKLVAEWSTGAPAARFTREAAIALERMKPRTP